MWELNVILKISYLYFEKIAKTSNLHKLVLVSADKVDLRRCDKSIALSNLSIYYTWRKYKKLIKNKKFKHGTINSNYLMDHIL